jgi:hypothetical protein
MKKLEVGVIIFDEGVEKLMEEDADFSRFVLSSIARHARGDYGEIDEKHKRVNDRLLAEGGWGIMGVYHRRGFPELLLITDLIEKSTAACFGGNGLDA